MIPGSMARTQPGKCETHTDNERLRQMVREREKATERSKYKDPITLSDAALTKYIDFFNFLSTQIEINWEGKRKLSYMIELDRDSKRKCVSEHTNFWQINIKTSIIFHHLCGNFINICAPLMKLYVGLVLICHLSVLLDTFFFNFVQTILPVQYLNWLKWKVTDV